MKGAGLIASGIAAAAAASVLLAAPARRTENVVLITTDGLRWQEVFGGADEALLTKEAGVAEPDALRRELFSTWPPWQRRRRSRTASGTRLPRIRRFSAVYRASSGEPLTVVAGSNRALSGLLNQTSKSDLRRCLPGSLGSTGLAVFQSRGLRPRGAGRLRRHGLPVVPRFRYLESGRGALAPVRHRHAPNRSALGGIQPVQRCGSEQSDHGARQSDRLADEPESAGSRRCATPASCSSVEERLLRRTTADGASPDQRCPVGAPAASTLGALLQAAPRVIARCRGARSSWSAGGSVDRRQTASRTR